MKTKQQKQELKNTYIILKKIMKSDSNCQHMYLYVTKKNWLCIVSNGLTYKILHYNICIPKFQRKIKKKKTNNKHTVTYGVYYTCEKKKTKSVYLEKKNI